ncbi:MAG: hypothetical protein PHX18_05355 [Candidatus Gastranaerophilales bacterium]|nr:hypothetical protein [Candidatus Gastranaerophilales bacterium]
MSVNLYQNNVQTANNFGAGGLDATLAENKPQALNMLQSMGLPSTPDEFVKFSPFVAGGVGFSYLVSRLATILSRVNPFKNPNVTLQESFDKSIIGKATGKVDNLLMPVYSKMQLHAQKAQGFLAQRMPNWMKNIGEKVKIGVTPKNAMALAQYKGLTRASSEYFLGLAGKLDPATIKKLGIDGLLAQSTKPNANLVQIVKDITSKLKNTPIGTLKELPLANSKKAMRFVAELNKSRAFIAANAKTPITRFFQKLFMSVSEAAGGGVIGGRFGLLMNSIFVAAGLKRTWDAPKGEKLSTFMEAALLDFCGGYLMVLLTTSFAYRMLGIKNVDKSALRITKLKTMTDMINTRKKVWKGAQGILENLNKPGAVVTPEIKTAISELGIKLPQKATSAVDISKAITTKFGPERINKAIDSLVKFKKFKSKGLVDVVNRPLTWIGKILSVGLDMTPSKLVQVGKVSNFAAFAGKFKNALKGITGYPMRLILIMMVLTPPLTKLCAKITHGLFGKPTNSSYADEEKKSQPKSGQVQTPFVNMEEFTNTTQTPQKNDIIQTQQDFASANIPAAPMLQPETSNIRYIPNPIASYAPQVDPGAIQGILAPSEGLEANIEKNLKAVKNGKIY